MICATARGTATSMEMLKIGRLAATMFALMAAGSVEAQDRWRYAGASDEFEIFLDSATASRSGDLVEVWVEHRYQSSKVHSRTSSLSRINCVRRTLSTLSNVEYDPAGKVKRSHTSNGLPEPIVPGTVGELTWGAACPIEAEPLGLEQVRSLGERLRRDDPDFEAKFSGISAAISRIQATLPPTLWVAAIELEWSTIPAQPKRAPLSVTPERIR